MTRSRPRALRGSIARMRIAPPKARLLAGLLDRLVFVLGLAGTVGAGIGAAALYERVRGDAGKAPADDDVDGSSSEFELSRPQQLALWFAAAGLSVRFRNRRSLGYRALRLRRVAARSRGPVTARSALLGAAFEWAWDAAIRRVHRGDRERTRRQMSAFSARVKEIERRHGDDPRARQRALTELQMSDTLHPLRGCGWRFATTAAWQLVPSIPIGGACIRDWVTGTVVVTDR